MHISVSCQKQQIQIDTKNSTELIEPAIKKQWSRGKTAVIPAKKTRRISKERLLKIQNTVKSSIEPRTAKKKEVNNCSQKLVLLLRVTLVFCCCADFHHTLHICVVINELPKKIHIAFCYVLRSNQPYHKFMKRELVVNLAYLFPKNRV